MCHHMIGEWHVCTHNGGHLGASTDAGRWCTPPKNPILAHVTKRAPAQCHRKPSPPHPFWWKRPRECITLGMGTVTCRSSKRCEHSLFGSVTRLLTRPSRLLRQTTTHPYRCRFTVRNQQPCRVDLDRIPSSDTRSQDRK
jgi:hypothetical protein